MMIKSSRGKENNYLRDIYTEGLTAENKLNEILISLVIHELRTPLTSIIGYVEMINKRVSLGETGRWAEKTLKECQRLKSYLDRYSHLSNIRLSRLRFSNEELIINRLIKDLIGFCERRYQSFSASFRENLDGNIRVLADREMLYLSILCFLKNYHIFRGSFNKIRIRVNVLKSLRAVNLSFDLNFSSINDRKDYLTSYPFFLAETLLERQKILLKKSDPEGSRSLALTIAFRMIDED